MHKKIAIQLVINYLSKRRCAKPCAANENGYALLSLILVLTILGIVLASSVTPNFQLSSQREKEAELFYRGQQMAEGIARWYNNGRLSGTVNLSFPPAYGYLKEMKKLKEGVRINLQDIKFVRASATRDPFDGEEWEPVYARDPRIMNVLQAWAGETGGIIPQQLMLIAGPPVKTQSIAPKSKPTPTTGSITPPVAGGTTAPGSNPANPPTQAGRRPNNPDELDDDDDDDDDDETINDPLGHLFSGGNKSGLPIVGVAPRRKGLAVRPYYGLKNYEEWVFIYFPPNNRFTVPAPNTNQTPAPGRTSQ